MDVGYVKRPKASPPQGPVCLHVECRKGAVGTPGHEERAIEASRADSAALRGWWA
jgi:hypothetical protein